MEATSYQTTKGELLEYYDEYAENPRTFSETSTVFYTFLRTKCSPDKHSFETFVDWMHNILGKSPSFKQVDSAFRNRNTEAPSMLVEAMDNRGYIALPVWKYEHSGCCYKAALSNPFNDEFDSCLAGFIYMSKTDVYKEYGKRLSPLLRVTILKRLVAEVEEYSDWANGECYYYKMGDDECGGFYGPIETNGALDAFDCKLI